MRGELGERYASLMGQTMLYTTGVGDGFKYVQVEAAWHLSPPFS
jgi:hypothetical protein